MWRRLFKKIWPVVKTVDYDGDIRFRFVFTNGHDIYCRAIMRWVELSSDGTIKDKMSYVEKWERV